MNVVGCSAQTGMKQSIDVAPRSKGTLVDTMRHDLLQWTLKNALRRVGGPVLDTQLPRRLWRQRRDSMQTMAANR
ncbi:MAG: hypothetical protein VYA30_09620 [Myxococcota bacterium]|nr:hypothetical protein [Myxococcota bacterium]